MTEYNRTPVAQEVFKAKRKPKGPIKFKLTLNEEQKEAKKIILETPVTLLKGMAGSGKTLLACQIALDLYFQKEIEKIIISRPTVSKEEIGFLPGDLKEKMDPWLAPIYSNLYMLYTKEKIDQMIKDEECFRVRGTILPGNKIEFRTPNLPPGKYDMMIYFKSGNDFEKVKYPDQLSVFTKDAVSNQTIIQENEIDSDEDSDLPDKTEMPWYRDGMTDDDLDTQVAIEIGEEMEGELKISDIKEV